MKIILFLLIALLLLLAIFWGAMIHANLLQKDLNPLNEDASFGAFIITFGFSVRPLWICLSGLVFTILNIIMIIIFLSYKINEIDIHDG